MMIKRAIFIILILAASATGLAATTPESGAITVEVTGNVWKDTGIDLTSNQRIQIQAQGKIIIDQRWRGRLEKYDYEVGPQGTYLYPHYARFKTFPLPSAANGPYPAYALIGRIGTDGEPFFIGSFFDKKIPKGGRLFLGINDFDLSDNIGAFQVEIEIDPKDQTPTHQDAFGPAPPPKHPKPPDGIPRVLTIYIDGLRPDVVQEMAANGYLPNIKHYILDQGITFSSAFTLFPTNTITSNGSLMTGMYSDKTGLKSQFEFDRKRGKIKNYLTKKSYTDVANVIRPVKEFWLGRQIKRIWLWCFASKEDYFEYKERAFWGPDALFNYLKREGYKWDCTLHPVLPGVIPENSVEIAVNEILQPVSETIVLDNSDLIISEYTHRYLIYPDARVISLWFSGVDHYGHIRGKGQFGAARKKLFETDRHLGRIFQKMQRLGMLEDTTIFLFSDHGQTGGLDFINQKYDLNLDFFYWDIEDKNDDGIIDMASGLGLNVKQMFAKRFHAGTDKHNFIGLDIASYNLAKVFLPYKYAKSRDWNNINSHYDLTNYKIDEKYQPVDLFARLMSINKAKENLFPVLVSNHPIDLLMLKLDSETVYLTATRGGQALIQHKISEDGTELYRYLPIKNFYQNEAGEFSYEATGVKKDPLNYLNELSRAIRNEGYTSVNAFFNSYHTDRTWLEVTANTSYPDSVVPFWKFFNWAPQRQHLEIRKRPDLVVTASPGWTFRNAHEPLSTDHGSPIRSNKQITLTIAGPNTPKGKISKRPVRIIDILPTILETLNIDYDRKEMDGKEIPEIIEGSIENVEPQPAQPLNPTFSGQSLDTQIEAQTKRDREERKKFPYPYSIHNLNRRTDLHNIFIDCILVLDVEVFSLVDLLFDISYPGDPIRPIYTGFELLQEQYDRLPDYLIINRFEQLIKTFRIRNINVSDVWSATPASARFPYPINLPTLKRVMLFIDFTQDVLMDISHLISWPIGPDSVHAPFDSRDYLQIRYLNIGIDFTQALIIDVRNIIIKYAVDLGDRGLLKLEHGIDRTINKFRKRPPEEQTVEIISTPGLSR